MELHGRPRMALLAGTIMDTRTRNWRRTVYGISLAAVVVYAAFGQRIHPSIALLTPLRIDLFALTVLGISATLRGAERAQEVAGFRGWWPSIPVGGLLGAAFVAPWAAFPWLVVPAMAMAWAGKGRGLGRIGTGAEWGHSGLAIVLLAAVMNSAVLAGSTSRGLRISPGDFAAQGLPREQPVGRYPPSRCLGHRPGRPSHPRHSRTWVSHS